MSRHEDALTKAAEAGHDLATGVNRYADALAKAIEAGHDLAEDPPWAYQRMQRSTCKRCGYAVLGNETTAYGSATEGPCLG